MGETQKLGANPKDQKKRKYIGKGNWQLKSWPISRIQRSGKRKYDKGKDENKFKSKNKNNFINF